MLYQIENRPTKGRNQLKTTGILILGLIIVKTLYEMKVKHDNQIQTVMIRGKNNIPGLSGRKFSTH